MHHLMQLDRLHCIVTISASVSFLVALLSDASIIITESEAGSIVAVVGSFASKDNTPLECASPSPVLNYLKIV